MSEKERDNLQKCLKIPGISEEHVRQVWNIAGELREGACEASKRQLYNVVRQRFNCSASCFMEKEAVLLDDTKTSLMVLDLPRAIQALVDKSPAWARAMREAHAFGHGELTALMYHDEVTCGNVLAVLERKKLTAFYLSFKELYQHLHVEQAWMPGMIFQKEFSDKLRGGLSAAVKIFVKEIHENKRISIFLEDETLDFELKSRSHLLSDHDAQRATFMSKGSAALKPCLFCANICKKDALRNSATFFAIDSADWAEFIPIEDKHWKYAVERLDACTTKKEQHQMEQTFGLNKDIHGLMWDEEARWALSPTLAFNDALHCYFANGVASCELHAYMASSEQKGWGREKYMDAAIKDNWLYQRHSTQGSESKVRRIFHEKMFDGDLYKGEAHDTRALVSLLAYYAVHLRDALENFALICDSFLALKKCCTEMSLANRGPSPLREEEEVRPWRDAQLRHQEICVRAHGSNIVRPKHHHRLHLPCHALQLGCVPDCSIQEKNIKF